LGRGGMPETGALARNHVSDFPQARQKRVLRTRDLVSGVRLTPGDTLRQLNGAAERDLARYLCESRGLRGLHTFQSSVRPSNSCRIPRERGMQRPERTFHA
jgi:hypothetical protein